MIDQSISNDSMKKTTAIFFLKEKKQKLSPPVKEHTNMLEKYQVFSFAQFQFQKLTQRLYVVSK